MKKLISCNKAEPMYANICQMLGLNRFTLRGKTKVNAQWKMYAVVHNMLKAYRYVPRDVPVYGAHGIGMGGVGPDESHGLA